jgi:hypothetical protein
MTIADRAYEVLEKLVHQLPDSFAFWPELIQNAIDANSGGIDCTPRFRDDQPARGVCAARVQDWGEGMTREIIEKVLLTKFRSAKEDDLVEIGKIAQVQKVSRWARSTQRLEI